MSTPANSRIEQLGEALGQTPGASATTTTRTSRGAKPQAAGEPITPSHTPSTSTNNSSGEKVSSGEGAGPEGGDSRTSEPERPMPAYLKRMPELIQDLWKRGVQFNIDTKVGDFLLDGFYTNGPLRLSEQDEGMVAIDKRGRKEAISSFDDLARINFRWWRLSTDKDRYMIPQRPWIDAFIQNKWVTRKVIYLPAEDNGDGTIPS